MQYTSPDYLPEESSGSKRKYFKPILFPPPKTPIGFLTRDMREYLHLEDPTAFHILMGAVAANMMEGPPVWLMFVGPPSCGKSELLNSLSHLSQTFSVAAISSEAAFLSGTSKRETAADATGGLLCQVARHGAVIINDFTSVLSQPKDKLAMIMAVFRECYGGKWTRLIGGEGGRAIEWSGKLALFAGVTGKIDQYATVSAELGERWVYCRFKWHDAWIAGDMTLTKSMQPGWQDKMRDMIRDFFENLDLRFGAEAPVRPYTWKERERLHKLAVIACRCRSAVSRDQYTRDIAITPETEMAPRIQAVLGQLLQGLDKIGIDDEQQRWRYLIKVAFDSMPLARWLMIEHCLNNPAGVTVETLAAYAKVSPSYMKEYVEDLTHQQILKSESGLVKLQDWVLEDMLELRS